MPRNPVQKSFNTWAELSQCQAFDASVNTFPQNMKTGFWLSEDPIGEDIICPRDGRPGCALVDWIPRRERREQTHFMSWTWKYSLQQVQAGKSWECSVFTTFISSRIRNTLRVLQHLCICICGSCFDQSSVFLVHQMLQNMVRAARDGDRVGLSCFSR